MLWHLAAGGLAIALTASAAGWQVRSWKAAADDSDRIRAEVASGRANAYRVDAAAADMRRTNGDQSPVSMIVPASP